MLRLALALLLLIPAPSWAGITSTNTDPTPQGTITVLPVTNQTTVSGSPVGLGGTVTVGTVQDLGLASSPSWQTATFSLLAGSGNRCVYADSFGILHAQADACGSSSPTGDNLGNHIQLQNLQSSGWWYSRAGGDDGIYLDASSPTRIGIGINAPATKVHVLATNGAGDGIVIEGSAANPRPSLWLQSHGAAVSREWNIKVAGHQQGQFLVNDSTGGTDPFVITVDGRVGLGHNIDPALTLDILAHVFSGDGLLVQGSAANPSPTIRLKTTGAATVQEWAWQALGGSSGTLVLVDVTALANRLYVTAAGRVGINVSPAFPLDVAGDANLSSGSVYRINSAAVLSGSTLGSGVTASSLTSVGTLTTGVWQATSIATAFTDAKVVSVSCSTLTCSGTNPATFSIADGALGNAKLATVATATFKGRTTAGTGAPEDLTVTQATALLNVFSSSLKGLAPSSGGGTVNFLRADGTWAAPPGGAGGTVTSIATTSPITGGTITTTGTIACATCVTSAASLTLNRLVFGAGSQGVAVGDLTGDVTTSGGKATTIGAGKVTNAMLVSSTITVTGTANRVTVSGSPVSLGGTVTLSGPQDLAATSAPTFAALTASATNAPIIAASSTANNDNGVGFRIVNTGTNGRDWRIEQGRSSGGQFNITDCSAGCAPRLTFSSAGALTLASYGLGLLHSSAGGAITSSLVSLAADVSGILPRLYGGWGSDVSGPGATGVVSFNSGTPIFNNVLTANRVLVAAAGNTVTASANLTHDGNKLVVASAATGDMVTLDNTATAFAATTVLKINSGSSLYTIIDARSGGTSRFSVSGFGGVTATGAVSTSGLVLRGSSSGDVFFVAQAAAGSATYTWPAADGTNDQVLTTNGSGILSWTGKAGGGGTGLTNLNGQTGATQTFTSDPNVTIASGGNNHALGWAGTLGRSRGGWGSDVSGPGATGVVSFNAGVPVFNNVLTAGQLLYGAASNTVSSHASLVFDVANLSLQLTSTAIKAFPSFLATNTPTGSRVNQGTISIPVGLYGSGGPTAATYVDGLLVNSTDATTYTSNGTNNSGAPSAAAVISQTLGAAYNGLGHGLLVQTTDNRVIGSGVTLPVEQDQFGVMSLLVANQTTSATLCGGVACYPGQPQIATVGYYALISRLTAANYVHGARLVISNFVNDQNTTGLKIDSGDAVNVGTEYTGGDAIAINTRNARNTVNAWTNAFRLRNEAAGVDHFTIAAQDGVTQIGAGTGGSFTHKLLVVNEDAPDSYIGIHGRVIGQGPAGGGNDVAAVAGSISCNGTTGPCIALDGTAFYTGSTTTAQLAGVNLQVASAVNSGTEAQNGILVNQYWVTGAPVTQLFAGVLVSNFSGGGGWQYGYYYKSNPGGRIFSVDSTGGVNTIGNYQVVRSAVTHTGVDCSGTPSAGFTVKGGVVTVC